MVTTDTVDSIQAHIWDLMNHFDYIQDDSSRSGINPLLNIYFYPPKLIIPTTSNVDNADHTIIIQYQSRKAHCLSALPNFRGPTITKPDKQTYNG